MRFRNGSDSKCVTNFVQTRTKWDVDPGNISQAFGEESISRTRKIQTQRNRKWWDRWRAKPRACASVSLTPRGLFTNNSSSQAKQSIPHTTVWHFTATAWKCARTSPRTSVATSQRIVSHLVFHQVFSLPKTTRLSFTTHAIFLFPR
jgi:hypothetical protein